MKIGAVNPETVADEIVTAKWGTNFKGFGFAQEV